MTYYRLVVTLYSETEGSVNWVYDYRTQQEAEEMLDRMKKRTHFLSGEIREASL